MIDGREKELLEIIEKLNKENQDSYKAHVKKNENGIFRCASCGNKIAIEDKYCSTCGKKLNWKYTFDSINLEEPIRYGGDFYEIKEMALDHDAYLGDTLTIKAELITHFSDNPSKKWEDNGTRENYIVTTYENERPENE